MMSLRDGVRRSKQSPRNEKVASFQDCRFAAFAFATCPWNDMQRMETERAIVHGNREFIRLYVAKVRKVIERVWDGQLVLYN